MTLSGPGEFSGSRVDFLVPRPAKIHSSVALMSDSIPADFQNGSHICLDCPSEMRPPSARERENISSPCLSRLNQHLRRREKMGRDVWENIRSGFLLFFSLFYFENVFTKKRDVILH